jgi:hypothetical protein
MTQTTGPELNKGCAVAALTPPARQVHLAVLAAFAQTGRPPARRDPPGGQALTPQPQTRLPPLSHQHRDRQLLQSMANHQADGHIRVRCC